MRRKTRRAALAVLLGLSLLAAFAVSARAMDVPQYDNTENRLRLEMPAQLQASQLYAGTPLYLELPAGVASVSTPTMVNGVLYQYAYSTTQKGVGYLYAITLPPITGQQVQAQASPGNYLAETAQWAAIPITFQAGTGQYDGKTIDYAHAQGSLGIGPYAGYSPSGTQYQAIGVGKYLYIWPSDSYPSGGTPPSSPTVYVKGNFKNTDYQIDENPLITPAVTVDGMDGKFPASWQSPVAVVGSWDGGLVAFPTYVPSGYTPTARRYLTSDPLAGSGSSPQNANTVAALTSDPTWIGPCSVGEACVAFGVAGKHPRVILMDVVSGNYTAIGLGKIGAQVADTVLFDNVGSQATHPRLIVQDIYGEIYSFNLSGTLEGTYSPSTWTSTNSEILGQDMSLSSGGPWGQFLFAVGGGGSDIGEFNPSNLSPYHISASNTYGPNVNSPTSLVDSSGNTLEVFSNAQGKLWLKSVGELFGGTLGGKANQKISVTRPPMVGFIPDMGTRHWLVSWTNSDPNGKPAIEAYLPVPYTVNAKVSPAQVASGSSVTIYGYVSPPNVTYDNGAQNGPGGSSPVEAAILNSSGQAVTGYLPMQRVSPAGPNTSYSTWSTTWTPPPNNTSSPVTYDVVVYAWDDNSASAESSSVPFSVDAAPPSSSQTAGNDGTLTIQCGYGHWNPTLDQTPLTVTHTCTIPSSVATNPPSWFANQGIDYGAKFGDALNFTLTIPTPTAPASLIEPGAPRQPKIEHVQLTATINHTVGYPNLPGYPGYDAAQAVRYHYYRKTTFMTQTSRYVAQASFVESWSGYPYTGLSAPATTPGTITWQGDMTANWTAVTTWGYDNRVPPFQNCVKTSTGQQCSAVFNWVWTQTTITTTGYASAPLVINGSDYWVISTPVGY